MGQFNLNLSSRPFRAYRAANLGLFILLLVLAAVSVGQVYSYQRYSELTSGIRENERLARKESEVLTGELLALSSKMYSGSASAKLSEIEFLNRLLLRKSFSWTRVFASLEEVIPRDVHLISLRPFLDESGMIGLNISVRGRSLDDANEFLRALETSDTFEDVVLAVEENKDAQPSGEVEFLLSTKYSPEGGE